MSPARLDLDRLIDEARGELIASAARTETTADLSRYHDDPVGFTRDVLRAEPTAQQVDFMRAVVADRRVALRAGFGVGKDWCNAALIIWWAWVRRGKVYVTSADHGQLVTVIATEVRRHFERANDAAPGILPGEVHSTHANPYGAHKQVEFKTSKGAEQLRGRHDPRGVLAIVSEGSGVPDFAYRALRDCCVDAERDRFVVSGNPTVVDLGNTFYRVFNVPDAAGLAPIRLLWWSALDHPNVTTRRSVIPGAISFAEVEERRRRGGDDWECGVLGNFITTTELDALVTVEQLQALADPAHLNRLLAEGRSQRALRVGLDVQRRATAAVLRGGWLFDPVRVLPPAADGVELTARVGALLRSLGVRNERETTDPSLGGGTRPCSIVVDVIGRGHDVPRLLNDAGWSATAFDSRAAPRRKPYGRSVVVAANARAEAGMAFQRRVQDRAIAFAADDPETLRELAAYRLYPDASGRGLRLTKKEDLIAHLGHSPDRGDAVLYAIWGSGGVTGMYVDAAVDVSPY